MEVVAMRNLNLDSFWRPSIGFDRLFDLMDKSLRLEPEDHYPPCNIVRTGEDKYRISLAVAGFSPEQLNRVIRARRRADDHAVHRAGERAEQPMREAYRSHGSRY